MKIIKLLFYLLIIFVLYYIYDLYVKAHATIENFEDKYDQNENYIDSFDKEFIDFYSIIYNEPKKCEYIEQLINSQLKNKNEPKILVVGSNCGNLLKALKKNNKHVSGLDKSELMLKKCHSNHPFLKTIKGDISKENLFEPSSFDAIIFESTLLNENSEKNINKILKNAYNYLKGNGIMMCPIYEEKTLTPRPRYYTTNYVDNKKNIHGLTYLNDFNHDCYYIKRQNPSDGFNYDYFDKIVLKSQKHRIKKTPMYIPEKEDFYQIIMTNGFELKKIYDLDDLDSIQDCEIAFFKKKNNKVDIKELEK